MRYREGLCQPKRNDQFNRLRRFGAPIPTEIRTNCLRPAACHLAYPMTAGRIWNWPDPEQNTCIYRCSKRAGDCAIFLVILLQESVVKNRPAVRQIQKAEHLICFYLVLIRLRTKL